MSALLLSALLAAAPGLTVPLDPPSLRARLIAGDLLSLERARAILAERGTAVATGPLALLDDLSRLERCLPLGPIPASETAPYLAARRLARLERVRLEARLVTGAPAGTELEALLASPHPARTAPAAQPGELVRWPNEAERWSDELPDPVLEPPACKRASTADPAAFEAAQSEALQALLRTLLDDLPSLPPEAAARIAYAASPLDPSRTAAIDAALDAGAAPLRTAGHLNLARALEALPDLDGARRLYAAVLADPTRTPAEESRARVRLARLLEPDVGDGVRARQGSSLPHDAPSPGWEAVLAVAVTEGARAEDLPALQYAQARALFALDRRDALMSFGRVWVRTRKAQRLGGPLIAATEDLLIHLALGLEPGRAMAWIEEVGPDTAREARLDRLGRLAIDSSDLELASAVYDRLRIEAAAARKRRGPAAAADLARWIGQRAEIEYLRDDAAAFAGLVADLLALAAEEVDRPLARTAPHRELARLSQALLGKLTNDVASDPERRRFAGALLEASVALAKTPGRWRPILEQHHEPLRLLAGPYAIGRSAPARRESSRPLKRPLRSLGEVVVARLPPAIEPPDYPSPDPIVPSFSIHESPGGAWRVGAPWSR